MLVEVNPSPLAPRDEVLAAVAVPVDRLDQVVVVPGQVQRQVRLPLEDPVAVGADVTIPAEAVEVLDGVADHQVAPAVAVPVQHGQGGPARLAPLAVELDRRPGPVAEPLAGPERETAAGRPDTPV